MCCGGGDGLERDSGEMFAPVTSEEMMSSLCSSDLSALGSYFHIQIRLFHSLRVS